MKLLVSLRQVWQGAVRTVPTDKREHSTRTDTRGQGHHIMSCKQQIKSQPNPSLRSIEISLKCLKPAVSTVWHDVLLRYNRFAILLYRMTWYCNQQSMECVRGNLCNDLWVSVTEQNKYFRCQIYVHCVYKKSSWETRQMHPAADAASKQGSCCLPEVHGISSQNSV